MQPAGLPVSGCSVFRGSRCSATMRIVGHEQLERNAHPIPSSAWLDHSAPFVAIDLE